jgi:plastocyanin
MSGTFTALDSTTNKIAWQLKTPYMTGMGGGSMTTAGGLVFRGESDGNFLALDARTGAELWRFQTGFGADAPAMTYEVDGEQFVAIATGGNMIIGSAPGDAVWAFSLKGHLRPLWPPPPPPTVAGPRGTIAEGVDKVEISNNNREYGYGPARIRVKVGTTVTWTNLGDLPHTATAEKREWDTGDLASGQSKAITFDKPGNYYYICTPHPWMYGQVIVEN